MSRKIRKQVIRCPSRKRDVEVTYAVTGRMFSRKYEILDCPAMFDSSESCNRQCCSSLDRPPRHLDFMVSRV